MAFGQEEVVPTPVVSSTKKPLRGFFIPFFATGHLIPLVDFARLLAERGVDCTILTTPANAAIVRTSVDRLASSGFPIGIHLYPFPSIEVGVPDGCENIASVPDSDVGKIFQAVHFVRATNERILREHRPDFIVADILFPWATWVARDLGVPRLSFIALSIFSCRVMKELSDMEPGLGVEGDDVPFEVPGLSGPPIPMVRAEMPVHIRRRKAYQNNLDDEAAGVDYGSYGVVLNTFYDLEKNYIHDPKDPRKKWCVGPVAQFYANDKEMASRGGGGGRNSAKCLQWPELQKPGTVVFVCFGSWCYFTADQLREMALGLEASNHPFLWVVRDEDTAELPWLPDGFDSSVEGRGLVVRGWAPQVAILNHQSVRAFVTHCGWNSVLEGVSAGLPMITWPLMFEQFINERLVVNVLKIGVRMYDGFRSTVEEEKVVVPGEAIAKSVGWMMSGGEEVEAMRRRAREYGKLAEAAVKEGGTSYDDLDRLIEDVRAWKGQTSSLERA